MGGWAAGLGGPPRILPEALALAENKSTFSGPVNLSNHQDLMIMNTSVTGISEINHTVSPVLTDININNKKIQMYL